MARRRLATLLAAFLVLAGVGIGALWVVLGRADGGSQLSDSSSVAHDPDARVEEVVAPAELAGGEEAGEPAPPATSERVARTGAEGVRAEFDLRAARWIEGRIALPAGAPVDLDLEVVALGEHRERIERGVARISFDRLQRSWEQREVHARAAVAADGTFRVPVPGGPEGDGSTEVALLDVDGRFLFLAEPERLDLGTPGNEPVVLEPLLGGTIRGTVRLPYGADEVPAAIAVVGLGASWTGHDVARSTEVDADLAFELRALHAGGVYRVSVDPGIYAAASVDEVVVQAGRATDVDVRLARGATVRGVVVGPGGDPLPGAEVHVSRFEVFASRRTATADAAGRFELRGLSPGSTPLGARADEHLDGVTEELALADGQVLEGVRIALDEGLAIHGVVRWPDGAPAGGASVLVSPHERFDATWLRRLTGEEPEPPPETGADGTFRVGGLSPGPYAVFAERAPRGTADEDAPPWTARRASVEAGGDALELVLAAPRVVAADVRDDTGAPLDAFTVAAQRQDWPGRGRPSSSSVQRKFSGAGGRFELGGLDAGTWKLTVSAAGHVPSTRAATVPAGVLEPFELTRCARLAGVVLDPGGRPAAGARVRGRPVAGAGRNDSAESDVEGRFELDAVGPGAVDVTTTSDDWAPGPRVTVDVLPGEAREDLVLALTRGGAIEGVVYGGDGRPAAGRAIDLQSPAGGSDREATSDAAGRFRLEHLAPGTYMVMAMPDPATLRGAQDDMGAVLDQLRFATAEVVEGGTTQVVLGAPPRAPVVVYGRVVRGGEPVPGANLLVLGEGGGLFERMRGDTSDADGHYEVELDEPGHYAVVVLPPQGGSTQEVELHVTVPEVDRHRVDLELPAGVLAGRVVGSDGKVPERPGVWLRREDGASELSALLGQGGLPVEPDGTFRAEGLHPGRYAVTASASGAASHTVHGVAVTAGAPTEGLELVVAAGGRLTGTVVDASGAPVEGALVFLRDADGRPLPRPTGTSSRTGSFALSGVPAGLVTASARADALASPESGPVRIVAGEESTVALEVAGGTVLRVALEDEEGRPLRASIRVEDERGRDHAGVGGAEEEHLFVQAFSPTERRVGPLPPGEYTVRAEAADGRAATRTVTLRGQDDRELRLRLED